MIKTEKFHSATISNAKLLDGILGLRGIAALAVLLYHVVHIVKIPEPEWFSFIRQGGVGVFLFFVLSAFSLMYSTERTMLRHNWVKEYLIKRFFRISPLFYTILAFMLLHAFMGGGLPNVSIVLLNLFFIFGFFFDPEIGLVMGGWTIGVEMIFYILFPILLMIIKTQKEAFFLMIIAMLVSYSARMQLHIQYLTVTPQPKWDPSYFTFITNLFFFTVGIYAYKVKQTIGQSDRKFRIAVLVMTILFFLIFTLLGEILKKTGRLDLIILGFGFGGLCLWQSIKPSFWSANKLCEYLGERSYSIYLIHPLIIIFTKKYSVNIYYKLEPNLGEYSFFICSMLIIGIVLIVAEVTYRSIEIPGINMGRKIIKKMEF